MTKIVQQTVNKTELTTKITHLEEEVKGIESIAQDAWRGQFAHLNTKQSNSLMNTTRKVAELLEIEISLSKKTLESL